MAASDYRIVRRRRGALTAAVPTPPALVAASSVVTSADDVFRKQQLTGRTDASWQDEAWELFDLVGELGCYVRWRARSCSRVKLVASAIDPDTGQPTGSLPKNKDGELTTEAKEVAKIVKSVAGGPQGQSEFIENAVTILSVPGEFWTVILIGDDGRSRWLPVSKQQIKRSQTRRDANGKEALTIITPEGKEHDFTPKNADGTGRDGMFRVWNPHPKMPTEPTSPVQANLDPLREIVRTSAKMANADRSRMGNNGLLVIPAEASLPDAQGPSVAGQPGAGADPHKPPVGRSLQQKIVDANDLGTKDPRSHAAITPIVITAPAEHLDKIKHISFGKDIADIELKKRDSAVLRFARGIDMEPDQLLGLGDTNHWNGHLLADQDVNLHVAPVMKTICQAFYRNVIAGMLKRKGIDPSRYVLTIDTSDLTADPDKTDEAKDAEAVGALRHSALLRHLGLPEGDGHDLKTLEGLQELALDKLAKADPSKFVTVLREVLPLLDPKLQTIQLPEPLQLQHPGRPPLGARIEEAGGEDVPVDGTPPPTEAKAPRRPIAAAVGVESFAVDTYLTAALAKAGNRRVKVNDREQFERVRDVEPHEYYRLMPPVAAADVPKLIRGYDTGLDELAAKHGLDAGYIRAVVEHEARRRLTSQVVDA